MKILAFEKTVALTVPLLLASCSLLTPLGGLDDGPADASISRPLGTDGGSPGCPTCDAAVPYTAADAAADDDAGDAGQIAAAVPDASIADAAGVIDAGASEAGPIPSEDAGPCTPPASPSINVCAAIDALAAPPVIDGTLDCGVPLWSMPVVVSSGPDPLPAGTQALVGAAWRPDGLYLFVSVSGVGPDRYPAPASEVSWCGDAIELFVDHDGVFPNAPSYNSPGTVQLVAQAPATTDQLSTAGQMFRNGALLGPWTGQFVSHATDDGFTTEAFVTASDLGLTTWALTAGGNVGLDIAVDVGASVDPGGCDRLAQFTVQVPIPTATGCAAGCNVGEFCTPLLQ